MPKGVDGGRINAHRSNGFDLLRLVGAGMVLYGHSFALVKEAPPGYYANAISTIGVKIFFIASGFLITRSWLTDPDPVRYVTRRALRLLPALACITLLTVFVLGPIMTRLSLSQYFGDPSTWQYLRNIALYPVYSLPGVFEQNLYPVAVNGSLWSLPSEVSMYAIVVLLLGRTVRSALLALPMCAFVLSVAALYYVRIAPMGRVVIYGSDFANWLEVAPYFLIGAVYSVSFLAGWLRFEHLRPWLSLAIIVVAGLTLQQSILGEGALLVLLPFAVVSLGSQHFGWLAKPLAVGDFSYGLYLYGFPVQQIVVLQFGNHINGLTEFAVALPITLALAMASWFLIERNALALKPRARKISSAGPV